MSKNTNLNPKSKTIKKKKKKALSFYEKHKHLIESGKAPELKDPLFQTYSKSKQKKLLSQIRNRISAQNSRSKRKGNINIMKL